MANAKRDQNRIPTLTGVSSADGITPVNVYVDPITHRLYVDMSSGAGITVLAATGVINGINTSFTFTQQPSFIVSDSAWYRVNLGWTWNGGALTATMSVPPQSDIFGVQ